MLGPDIEKYAYIDALRGWAILGVILVHSSHAVEPSSGALLWVMREGARGVQLFFVTSALTLCMSWMSRSSREDFPIRNFYIRRFFRIAPMFYIAILTYCLLNGFSPSIWAPNGIRWWYVPLTAAFVNGFHPETITSVVPGGWSIAVEMNFYIILPFLLPLISSVRSGFFLLMVGLALSGFNVVLVPRIFAYPESQQYLVKNFCYFNIFGQLPVFIMGMICYFILRRDYPKRQIEMVGGFFLIVLLVAFLYPAFPQTDRSVVGKLIKMAHHLIAGGMFAVFAVLLAHFPVRLLVNRFTVTVGRWSFSMYLSHFAILSFFSAAGFSRLFPVSDMASILHFLCVVPVTAVVSAFFYRYVEKPGIALGKSIIDRLDRRESRIPSWRFVE
jgi:peptidoglycan/LPS O-acetylase OafA/YrhL